MAAQLKRRSQIRRLAPPLVVVALVAGIAFFGWWKVNQILRGRRGHTEDELKAALVESGRLQVLEDWAMSKVGGPVDALDGDSQPADADVGRVHDVYPFTSESGTIDYMLLEFGGGFRQYGLLIGNVPNSLEYSHYNDRWSERVVYYDEFPQE